MDWSLEVVLVPVADVERAKRFYVEQLHDAAPGSAAWFQLVVDDIEAARAELLERGAEVGEVYHFEGAERRPGRGGPWNAFLSLFDPDGNPWTIQERPHRGSDR